MKQNLTVLSLLISYCSVVIDRSAEILILFGRGLLFYINESILCKKVNLQLPEDVECVALELNLRVMKWLKDGLYKSPNRNES